MFCDECGEFFDEDLFMGLCDDCFDRLDAPSTVPIPKRRCFDDERG